MLEINGETSVGDFHFLCAMCGEPLWVTLKAKDASDSTITAKRKTCNENGTVTPSHTLS